VLSLGFGFEGASSGYVGLVAFRIFFLVVNLRWPGMRAVCVAGVAVREDWAGLLLLLIVKEL
jgi:hypothetical protein